MMGRARILHDKSGLTLLEMIIALAIVTILAVGIFVGTSGNSYRALHNASLALQADLRYTQRRAIMEGARHGIIFDMHNNRYNIVVDQPRQIIRTVYMPSGVRLFDATHNQLMFLPRGTSSSGFRVTLVSGAYSQDLTATVSGGRVRIWDIVPF